LGIAVAKSYEQQNKADPGQHALGKHERGGHESFNLVKYAF
jgi:hypothetical protein